MTYGVAAVKLKFRYLKRFCVARIVADHNVRIYHRNNDNTDLISLVLIDVLAMFSPDLRDGGVLSKLDNRLSLVVYIVYFYRNTNSRAHLEAFSKAPTFKLQLERRWETT